MIIFIEGNLGAGKTLNAISIASRISDRQDRKLITNFPIDFEKINYQSHQFFSDSNTFLNTDIAEFSNSTVIIDEANKWFNSRQWKDNDFFAFLTYARKLNCYVIIISQRISQIDKQMRDLGDQLLFIKNPRNLPIFGLLFSFFPMLRFYIYEVQGVRHWELINLDKKLFSVYNTNYIPGVSGNDKLIQNCNIIQSGIRKKIKYFIIFILMFYFVKVRFLSGSKINNSISASDSIVNSSISSSVKKENVLSDIQSLKIVGFDNFLMYDDQGRSYPIRTEIIIGNSDLKPIIKEMY